MKKLMIAAVAAVAASVTIAESAIESSNIVGYVSTVDEVGANTFSLGASPFTAVGSDAVNVQDMLVPSGVTACSFAKRATQAAQLQVWNGTGYTYYYYVNDAYVEDTDSEVTGWADSRGDFADAVIAPGTGYWYKYPVSASSFTLPGQVLAANSVSKNVYASKFNLVSNPYPTVLDLSKITTDVSAPAFSKRTTQALQLQVWNGTGYTYYYYVNDAYVEASDSEVTGWADSRGDYVGLTSTAVNYGFWVKSPAGDGKITFAK